MNVIPHTEKSIRQKRKRSGEIDCVDSTKYFHKQPIIKVIYRFYTFYKQPKIKAFYIIVK